MTKNQRQYPRQNIEVAVELCFHDDCSQTAITRDISEGGAFLCLGEPEKFPMGEMINMRYPDPLNNDTPANKEAVIVRKASDGIAVAFIEIDEF